MQHLRREIVPMDRLKEKARKDIGEQRNGLKDLMKMF